MNTKKDQLNVYIGPNALNEFLDPEKYPILPLVELPDSLNPLHKDGVHIYAKLLNLLPLGNVKAISAYSMIHSGELKNKQAIIEYSSGNTIFSAAAIAKTFGVKRAKTLISHEAFWSRIQTLRFLGVEVTVHKEPVYPKVRDPRSGIYRVQNLAKQLEYFCLRQYENQANPDAHEKLTGPQIWQQLGKKLHVFCAGMGTTGTILGTSKYLKSRNKKITTIGVTRTVDSPVPGVRSKPRLNLIDYNWQPFVDHLEEVGLKESYTLSLKMCREGILVGPSSGFALAGLINFLKKQKKNKTLAKLKNGKKNIHAVFICCDGPFQYLDEYFDYVDPKLFPPVKNSHLLANQRHIDYHKHR
jgi:cysteine synthase